MNAQGTLWSALAACCVALASASCVVRLAALYRGPDLVVLVEKGGARALRALVAPGEQGHPRAWLLAEVELDLEASLLRWAAAPRVAARGSTATGFLFAALSFRTILEVEGPAEGASGAVLAGVLHAIAPILWGMAGLAFALATDRLARARVKELRRAYARLVGLMCVASAPLVPHELVAACDDRVAST